MRKNKAFLEQEEGRWSFDFVYNAISTLERMEFEIVPFDSNDLEDTLFCWPIDPEKDIIIGGVGSTRAFFEHCEVKVPEYIGYPEALKPYLFRDISVCTIGDLRDLPYPYFIKPYSAIKGFTGCLVDSDGIMKNLKFFDKVKDEDKVFLSTPINFVSEYRCFVHEGELKGIQFYQGDFRQYPNPNVIEEMIKVYDSDLCAYTLDVGVTDEGVTALVEVNDMWAIGQYGLEPRTYTLMCVRRLRQIVRESNGETEPLWRKLKERYV